MICVITDHFHFMRTRTACSLRLEAIKLPSKYVLQTIVSQQALMFA